MSLLRSHGAKRGQAFPRRKSKTLFLYAELMQILGAPNEKKRAPPQNAISHAFLIIKAIGLTTALYIIIKFCQHAFKAL